MHGTMNIKIAALLTHERRKWLEFKDPFRAAQ